MATKNNVHVIFDLDDTLYNEIDYLKSAFLEIAFLISEKANIDNALLFDKMLDFYFNKLNVFVEIIKFSKVSLTVSNLLSIYRNHVPNIELLSDRKEILDSLKSKGCKMGLLTDGRSEQQRNKIEALNIEHYFEGIVISEEFGSEKPNESNYLYFEKLFGKGNYIYVADNTSKDFLSPNKLGWSSICILDNGNNIHKQDFGLEEKYKPQFTLGNFSDLIKILEL